MAPFCQAGAVVLHWTEFSPVSVLSIGFQSFVQTVVSVLFLISGIALSILFFHHGALSPTTTKWPPIHPTRRGAYMWTRIVVSVVWTILCLALWLMQLPSGWQVNGILATISGVGDCVLIWCNYSRMWNSVSLTGCQFAFYLLHSVTLSVELCHYYVQQQDSISQCLPLIVMHSLFTLISIVNVILTIVLSPLKTLKVQPLTCPEVLADIPSKCFFSWLDAIIASSYRKPLQSDDVFHLRETEQVQFCYAQFCAAHQPQRQESSSSWSGASLYSALLQSSKTSLCLAGVLSILSACIQVTSPILVGVMVSQLAQASSSSSSSSSVHDGMLANISLALAFFFVQASAWILYEMNCFLSQNASLRVQSTLTRVIYGKALRLSAPARQVYSTGEIINLCNIDTERVEMFTSMCTDVISSPLQIVLCLLLVGQQLGGSVVASVLVLLTLLLGNAVFCWFAKCQNEQQFGWKDRRLKLLSDVLHGIRTLKLHAWEEAFAEKVRLLRQQELKCLGKVLYGWILTCLLCDVSSFILMLASFFTFVHYGGGLQALTQHKAFMCLSLFYLLRFPVFQSPYVAKHALNCGISLQRIAVFLNASELEGESLLKAAKEEEEEAGMNPPAQHLCPAIQLEAASFTWNTTSKWVLENLNFNIPHGRFIAVVGKIGVGKSSLLSSIMGEVQLVSGTRSLNGSVAYVPQCAWLQRLTVKENILFGANFDKEWYSSVLDKCSLRQDMASLPQGDDTAIGDCGVTLSGGQKQRVSLARAVYQNADIYLLDDPLSAVDAQVGKELFDNVLSSRGGILQFKTRIMVTHGLLWLPYVDEIIVMGPNGRVINQGSYEALMRNGSLSEAEPKEDPCVSENNPANMLVTSTNNVTSATTDALAPDDKECLPETAVPSSIYFQYTRKRGVWSVVLVLLLYFSLGLLNVRSTILIQQFTEDPLIMNSTLQFNISHASSSSLAFQRSLHYAHLFAILSGILCLLIVGIATVHAVGSIHAAGRLHQNLLVSILRAPMSFFDQTPIGRILNRFSRDTDAVDGSLPDLWNDCIQFCFSLLTAFVGISYGLPMFMLAAVLLLVLYILIQRYYVPIARQSRRLALMKRSPILMHFTESLAGAEVIRSFGKRPEFCALMEQLVDENAQMLFLKKSSLLWLNTRLEVLGPFVVLLVVGFVLLAQSWISPGMAGLAVVYALTVTENLRWLLRQSTEIETDMVSMERIVEYCNLKPEESPTHQGASQPVQWTCQGEVRFVQFSARYRPDLPLSLHRIHLHIPAGEKVGVVGRTGAGKSSLVYSLFRLLQAEEGCIQIDNIDISQLTLRQLRSEMSILPQDPVQFHGTLRENIDPFHTHSEEELWEVLDAAHLKVWASALPLGLQHECGEGGQNLSLGQRQLLCLARALLRKSKLLILDEVTAAVDRETDQCVMQTIFDKFHHATVFIIAHRLHTILNTDRVVVMKDGSIAEMGKPLELMMNSHTLFHKMAIDAGLIGQKTGTLHQS